MKSVVIYYLIVLCFASSLVASFPPTRDLKFYLDGGYRTSATSGLQKQLGVHAQSIATSSIVENNVPSNFVWSSVQREPYLGQNQQTYLNRNNPAQYVNTNQKLVQPTINVEAQVFRPSTFSQIPQYLNQQNARLVQQNTAIENAEGSKLSTASFTNAPNNIPNIPEISNPSYISSVLKNPTIRKIVAETKHKKRYLVVHPNGTVEHVDSLNNIIKNNNNYVLINSLNNKPQVSPNLDNIPIENKPKIPTKLETPVNILKPEKNYKDLVPNKNITPKLQKQLQPSITSKLHINQLGKISPISVASPSLQNGQQSIEKPKLPTLLTSPIKIAKPEKLNQMVLNQNISPILHKQVQPSVSSNSHLSQSAKISEVNLESQNNIKPTKEIPKPYSIIQPSDQRLTKPSDISIVSPSLKSTSLLNAQQSTEKNKIPTLLSSPTKIVPPGRLDHMVPYQNMSPILYHKQLQPSVPSKSNTLQPEKISKANVESQNILKLKKETTKPQIQEINPNVTKLLNTLPTSPSLLNTPSQKVQSVNITKSSIKVPQLNQVQSLNQNNDSAIIPAPLASSNHIAVPQSTILPKMPIKPYNKVTQKPISRIKLKENKLPDTNINNTAQVLNVRPLSNSNNISLNESKNKSDEIYIKDDNSHKKLPLAHVLKKNNITATTTSINKKLIIENNTSTNITQTKENKIHLDKSPVNLPEKYNSTTTVKKEDQIKNSTGELEIKNIDLGLHDIECKTCLDSQISDVSLETLSSSETREDVSEPIICNGEEIYELLQNLTNAADTNKTIVVQIVMPPIIDREVHTTIYPNGTILDIVKEFTWDSEDEDAEPSIETHTYVRQDDDSSAEEVDFIE